MLPDWENKRRQHWPHHYRDILDKLDSPLGLVAVSDAKTNAYLPHDKLLIKLEKSFKEPIVYKVIVQDFQTSETLDKKEFMADELTQALRLFIDLIGDWTE
jgi:hypothetical protein